MTRRWIAAFAVGAVFLTALVGLGGAVRAEDSPVAQRAFEEIQACVSDPDAQLNVLYVVDESGSLTETDPQGVRADVIAQSLGELGRISERREVFTSIAMFGDGFRVERPWQPLTPESAKQEAQWSRETVGGLTGGTATDWLSALTGAADTMDASPNAASACKVVIWITDGAIYVRAPDGSESAEATIQALAAICGADPYDGAVLEGSPAVARLRTSGVNVIGVLLNTGTASEQQQQIMTYMRPIVEGQGTVDPGGFFGGPPPAFELACGQAPIPENQAAGAFVEADDPLDLAIKFAEIFLCIAEPCPDPVRGSPFDIDAGVGYFYVLLVGDEWTILPPTGAEIITPTSTANGVTITKSGDLRIVKVRGEAVEVGTWAVKGVEAVTTYRFTGIELALDVGEAFAAEEAQLRFTVLRDGKPLDSLDAYQPTTLEVTASQPGQDAAELTCVQDGALPAFVCPFTPDQVGNVSIRAELPLTSVGGIQFPAVPYQAALRVQPTPDYPQIREADDASGVHQLTALVGRRGAATGTFTLEGPARGGGAICFTGSSGVIIEIDPQPERVASYAFSGLPDGCVALGENATSTVTLSVSNPVSATGTVQGSFIATLKSDSRAEEATQEVVFAFSSDRKADPPIALLVGLTVLGLALPLGLLYLQSTRAARLDLK
jgi:hypothetical protein